MDRSTVKPTSGGPIIRTVPFIDSCNSGGGCGGGCGDEDCDCGGSCGGCGK